MRIFVICSIVLFMAYLEADRLLTRFNSYRGRVKLPGMRKLYPDDEMAKLAQKATNECSLKTEDGDYGIFYSIERGNNEADVANNFAKNVYTKNREPISLEANEINFFAPKAYKAGCSYNENCQPSGLYLCYVNHKMTHEDFVPVPDPCSSCSETFSVCDKLCQSVDDVSPTTVPEDQPLVVKTSDPETHPSDSLEGKSIELAINSEDENSANGLAVSLGLMNAVVILFHLLGN